MKLVLILLFGVAACGGHQEAPARTADRARATVAVRPWAAAVALPDPRPKLVPSTFGHTKARTGTLKNGVRLIYLERHDLPIVAITVAVARGEIDEQKGVVGILFDLLRSGPKDRKPRMWEYLGWLGARASDFVQPELSGITFETLSSHTTSVVLTAGEMFRKPSFDDEEVDESKRDAVATLRSWRAHVDDAGTQAALATLGVTHRPDPDVVAKIGTPDIERAYRALIAPDSLVVSVVGDFEAAQMQRLLEQAFNPLGGNAKPVARTTPVATAERFVLLDRMKGEQSAIVIVTPAPRVIEADAAAFRLTCGVLRRRLWDGTRLAKGYTYGGQVSCTGFEPFMKLTIDVAASRTKEALADVLSVMQSMRDDPASLHELAAARATLALSFTARFNTNAEASKELARAVAAGLPADALASLYDQTAAVTAEQTTAAAQKWMADPHVVVLGDVTAVTGDISTVGIGAPIVRSMP